MFNCDRETQKVQVIPDIERREGFQKWTEDGQALLVSSATPWEARVGDGFVIPSDRQTQDYLLCEACEDLMNKGGESWLILQLARIERKFPFYDLLINCPPEFEDDEVGSLYLAARNPAIKVEKLAHFAMGIFWKASVHSWRGGVIEPMIKLGPYSEAIRRWLRGEIFFPEHVVLMLGVSPPLRAQITLNPPW